MHVVGTMEMAAGREFTPLADLFDSDEWRDQVKIAECGDLVLVKTSDVFELQSLEPQILSYRWKNVIHVMCGVRAW